jgi:hypothetical protein
MAAARHKPTDSGILSTSQGGAFPLSLLLPRVLLNSRYQILARNLPFLGLNRQRPTSLPVLAHSHVRHDSMPWGTSEPAVWITGRAPSPSPTLPAAPARPSDERRTPNEPSLGTVVSLPVNQENHLQLLAALSPVMHEVVRGQTQANGGRRSTGNTFAPNMQFSLPQMNPVHVNMLKQAWIRGATVRQLLTINLWYRVPPVNLPQEVEDSPTIPPMNQSNVSLVFGVAQGETSQPAAPGQGRDQRTVASTMSSQAASPRQSRSAEPAYLVWRAMAPQEQTMARPAHRERMVAGQEERAGANTGYGSGGSRQAPGPYVAPPLSQMVSLQQTIIQSVERQVTVEMERQRMEMARELSRQSRNAQNRAAIDATSAPAAIVSDALVQTLLQKMRTLLQDERFRQGYIR